MFDGLIAGMNIIRSPHLTVSTRARRHRKKRIDKKWLKRYGFRVKPDPHLYRIDRWTMVGHPETVQIALMRFGQKGGV